MSGLLVLGYVHTLVYQRAIDADSPSNSAQITDLKSASLDYNGNSACQYRIVGGGGEEWSCPF